MQSLDNGSTGRFEVSLDRYLLSHSASNSWLLKYVLHLFEEAILPGWLSHYVLSIGNEDIKYYFDLCRGNKQVPFASIAYFRVVNAYDEAQARDFDMGRRVERLVLGTTDVDPSDIVRTVAAQDQIYEKNFVSASNCLTGTVPRQYSLHQANCQHFVLELIRRINVECEPGAYAELKQDSNRPRFYSLSLLSTCGMLVNLALVEAIPRPGPIIITVAILYHILYAIVIIHDYSVRIDRARRFYNENRYFGQASVSEVSLYNRRIITQQSTPRSEVRYLSGLFLYTTWMAWPLFIPAYYGLPKLRVWTIFGVVLGATVCYICICLFANGVLAFLKRNSGTNRLKRREEDRRAIEAFAILEKRWELLGIEPICDVCEPVIYQKKREKVLSNIIEYIETSQEPCGKGDMEKAMQKWRRKHLSYSERRLRYSLKVMFGTYSAAALLMGLFWFLYKRYHHRKDNI